MSLAYVGYKNVTADAIVKTGPTKWYGFVCSASSSLNIAVYDGTSTSGTLLYAKAVSAGDVVHFGGPGMALNSGLFVDVVSGTGAVNVMYQ